MTCREVIEVLAEYLGSALSPETVRGLEEHLAGSCPLRGLPAYLPEDS